MLKRRIRLHKYSFPVVTFTVTGCYVCTLFLALFTPEPENFTPCPFSVLNGNQKVSYIPRFVCNVLVWLPCSIGRRHATHGGCCRLLCEKSNILCLESNIVYKCVLKLHK